MDVEPVANDLDLQMYVPITRIESNYGPNKDKWMVEGQATSDAIDSYGTIFDYDSSVRAFETWRGNIREMHQNKAVGRALEWIPDPDKRAITVRAFVSKGAPGTWEKVNDGTLSGFSIGVPKGGYKLKMVERNGKSVPMYYDHKLAEVSLVDNPGSPGCDIAIVRADGMLTDVVDTSEDDAPAPELERTGKAISAMNRDHLHGIRNSAMQMCSTNGCDECGGMMASQSGDRSMEVEIQRVLSPIIQRMNATLSGYAARPQPTIPQSNDEAITRHIEAMETRYESKLSEVRALLSDVKGLAEKIAAQPMPGGPMSTPVRMDKTLAISPVQQGYSTQDQIAILQRAAQMVPLDQDAQVKFATEIIKLQNSH